MTTLASDDFTFLSTMLKKRSGLVLTPDKLYLVESRLMPIARKENLPGIPQLVAKLKGAGSEALQRAVTDAMTTNESLFFRDKTPFDLFEKEMIPALAKSRGGPRKLRVWCAAASTGQEPYSLAITIKEKPVVMGGFTFEIVGTDICADVLQRAQDGVYSQFEVQRGLPIQMLVKYFAKDGDNWRIKPEIKSMVSYRLYNLLDSFAALGTFDIVFCRNVLIYFDKATKEDIIRRIHALLPPDGYLVLGAAETVVGLDVPFTPAPNARGLYVKASASSAPMRAAG